MALDFGVSRGMAVMVSTIAAAVIAAAVAGRSCGPTEDSPEATWRSFVAAARRGDREGMYELLGPEARKSLELAAASATELTGSGQRFRAFDMIRVSSELMTASYRRISEAEGKEYLEFDTPGAALRVEFVREAGAWRVEVGSLTVASPPR